VSVLGLIPARGGSKGIPRKNVRTIAGKPLIAWTIEAALASERLDRVVVTTDDHEIADVAAAYGADVPFMRPAKLACDETPGIEPVLHAIQMLPGFDRIALLQPTSPLRVVADIEAAVAMAEEAASVVSVTEARHEGWIFPMDASGLLEIGDGDLATRRQDMARRYALNGAIYVATVRAIRENRSFLAPGVLGYTMPAERSIDIDDWLDWQTAEMLLSRRASSPP
jgi:CMP-N-acetylneuraminic acid synthetase